jgi:hypothetical protein
MSWVTQFLTLMLAASSSFSAHANPECVASDEAQVFVDSSSGELVTCLDGKRIGLKLSKTKQTEVIQGPAGPAGSEGADAIAYIKGGDIDLDHNSTQVELASGDYFEVTGTADLISFKPASAGKRALLHFTQLATVRHDPSKIRLAGGGDFKVYAGDKIEFLANEDGSWHELRRISTRDSSVWAVYATAQTITASTPTVLIFDQEIEDTQAEYNPTTGEFTVAQNGLYSVEVHARSANISWNSGNHLALSLNKISASDNSTSTVAEARNAAFSNITQRMTVNLSTLIQLNRGDKLTVVIDSAKASPIDAAASNSSVYFQVRKVR